jgi:hypothetical protein
MCLMIGLLSACSESDIQKETATTATKETKQKEETPETQQLKIGDTVNFDGLKITLNSVRIQEPGQFQKPQKGQFVVVNVTAENTTKKEQTISSLLNVELYDKEGYKYSGTILTEGIQGQFDGKVVAGGVLRGEIPFDVPASDTYELHFSNPFQTGKAVWVIPSSSFK